MKILFLFFMATSFIFTILPKQKLAIALTGISILTYQAINKILENYKTRYLDKESMREDYKKCLSLLLEKIKDDKEFDKFFIDTINKLKQINNTQLIYGTSILLYGLWLGLFLSEYRGTTS